MTARARRFCTVRLSNAEHIAQGWTRRFQIELRRLGQIGGLAEVVQTEQCRATFDLRLHERGRESLQYPCEDDRAVGDEAVLTS